MIWRSLTRAMLIIAPNELDTMARIHREARGRNDARTCSIMRHIDNRSYERMAIGKECRAAGFVGNRFQHPFRGNNKRGLRNHNRT